MAKCEAIYIGKTGENLVTEYTFPDFEGFPASLSYQRPGENAPYPITLEQADDGWLWVIDDTALETPGWGKAEVVYTEGEKIKKSDTYMVYVAESLSPSGEPPEPWQSYYDDIIAAGNLAEESADSARLSALSAQGFAEEAEAAKESAEASSISASGYAAAAAGSAGAAEGFAEEAEHYADLAEQSAAESGYMFFEIDERGHLIYQRTDSVDNLDFELDNGHLILEVA